MQESGHSLSYNQVFNRFWNKTIGFSEDEGVFFAVCHVVSVSRDFTQLF